MTSAEQSFTEFVRGHRDVLGRTAMVLCGDRSTANGDTDHVMTGPIMDVLSQV